MDIMDRINVMKEYGIVDDTAYNDLVTIVSTMRKQFDITLTEENAGVMITHIASAFGRNRSGEMIDAVAAAASGGLREDPGYDKAVEILSELRRNIKNDLSEIEQEYVLLHLCTLLYSIDKNRRKEAMQ